MIPVSTRLDAVRVHGLLPVAKRLLDLGAPSLVLEGAPPDGALDADLAAASVLRPPTTAIVAPTAIDGESTWTIAAADPAWRDRAHAALTRSFDLLSVTRTRTLIVPVGRAVSGDEASALASNVPDVGATSTASTSARAAARAAHAEAICRVVFDVARLVDPVRVLLLPDADPLSFMDLETAGWLLEGLSGRRVGLALDSGWTGRAAASGVGAPLAMWTNAFSAKLGFLLISEHDLRTRTTGPGDSGSGDTGFLRDVISRSLPFAWRPAPGASSAQVIGGAEDAERQLGWVGGATG